MKLNHFLISSLIATSAVSLFASSETDSKIENAAKESYNYRTVLEDNVKVKARDGVVTLTGTVQDKDDKALAADTVENLPGVTRVKNEIVVKPAYAEHSDGWMALKIRGRLLTKSNVSATSTKVSVTDGNVVLSGAADSPAQKELTEVYAKDIDGVKTVKNEMVVSANSPRATIGDTIDDASITSQVKYELLSHKSTSALKTKIVTNDGIVVITGMAANDAERSLVSKLAESTRGVKSVKNEMTVKN